MGNSKKGDEKDQLIYVQKSSSYGTSFNDNNNNDENATTVTFIKHTILLRTKASNSLLIAFAFQQIFIQYTIHIQ